MARHLRAAINHVKRQVPLLPVDVDALADQLGHSWRRRKLTPAVTVRLFMLQVLNGNLAISALRHAGGVAMQSSSFCAARMRLPLALFARLFDAVAEAAGASGGGGDRSGPSLLNGRRVLLADATSFSMPDTAALPAPGAGLSGGQAAGRDRRGQRLRPGGDGLPTVLPRGA